MRVPSRSMLVSRISPAPSGRLGGPLDGVEAGGAAAAVGVDAPAGAVEVAAGVDGDDDALAAEDIGTGVDERRDRRWRRC